MVKRDETTGKLPLIWARKQQQLRKWTEAYGVVSESGTREGSVVFLIDQTVRLFDACTSMLSTRLLSTRYLAKLLWFSSELSLL